MTIFRHELRQGRLSWILWTVAISALMAICVGVFPTMRNQTVDLNALFSSMGSFSEAFGMDRLNVGTLIGFYAVECGAILGLGGGFYSALAGVNALSKEEGEKTAEFLLSHPIDRSQVVTEKLLAMVLQIVTMDLVLFAAGLSSVLAIGEPVPWKDLCLMHLAAFFLHLQLGSVCFGISAFLQRGGPGVGLGLTVILYFFHMIANISDNASFLYYLTPYSFTDGAEILSTGTLDRTLIALGMVLGIVAILLAYGRYTRKDLH